MAGEAGRRGAAGNDAGSVALTGAVDGPGGPPAGLEGPERRRRSGHGGATWHAPVGRRRRWTLSGRTGRVRRGCEVGI